MPLPAALPSWLTNEDLLEFVKAFEQTGFVGALNWFRNTDRDRQLLAFLAHSKIEQPSIFAAGSEDAVVAMYRAAFDDLETLLRVFARRN